MGYVETLFGHQDFVLSLDSLRGDSCVSVGGRDKTVRFWKIVDETQLVFRGGGRSRIREVLEGGLGAVDEADEEEATAAAATKVSTKKFVEGSLECVAMIDETTFLSGGDTGYVRTHACCAALVLTVLAGRSVCGAHKKRKPSSPRPWRMD